METLVSVHFRPQNRDLGMVMREVDQDLAIYLGMRDDKNDRKDCLLELESDGFDGSSGELSNSDGVFPLEKFHNIANDNFHQLEMDNSDSERLPLQPDASSHHSLEACVQDSVVFQTENSTSDGIYLKLESVQSPVQPGSGKKVLARVVNSANKKSPSASDRKATPRSATPTGRPNLPAKTNSSCSSTPTLKAKLSSAKPAAANPRSITPSRYTPSSTSLNKEPAQATSKSSTRSSTPSSKVSTPSMSSGASSAYRSSSRGKTGAAMLKSPSPSRGTYPSLKTLTSSLDAPQTSKILMPKRPASASRERPSMLTIPLTSTKPSQKSFSPSKTRAQNETLPKSGSMILTRSRGHTNDGDALNPILLGTKMVERVVNMRKLVPPKQAEYSSNDYSRKTVQENSGFGRSLSQKSLDMAMRHMDIRRSIPENLRSASGGISSTSTGIPQSGSAKTRTNYVSESPFGTRSDSSEHISFPQGKKENKNYI